MMGQEKSVACTPARIRTEDQRMPAEALYEVVLPAFARGLGQAACTINLTAIAVTGSAACHRRGGSTVDLRRRPGRSKKELRL